MEPVERLMECEERPVEPAEPLTEPVELPESLDAAAIRAVQERAARALPAVHVEQADGWWLRRFRGASWWIGSVLPHADADGTELLRRVEAAEAFHAAGGTVPRFQITPGVCPPRLDALLAARGYRRESARLTGLDWTFVTTGVSDAVAVARQRAEAASADRGGDLDVVLMGGGATIGSAITAGLVDVLSLHLTPVVLSAGTPLFTAGAPRTLVRRSVTPTTAATHLIYDVVS